ncbi:carbohydrate ABC transporter substrate-binding protein, CUT1 family (TC 3.A.1.1.-) [Bifidobacterium bohemicum]|uniref:Extracellular solute-binding protein family 1 n=1 Tax=Bifidobacterium bohemicum DSM 22767 TaxID=1437606 RepID=A0A086ZHA2_9BIFI|nr:extracellular solute-binding protein [Bifidobacterium bohemicum]KFI45902.1 extracellular solute-binding protein family 1 [Bifidobacterium bohemicum DSM 22767]SCC16741.1 carbohydrate ABC transporter substrate-binding protein, CUT1 family (TC 3.A.1.1.-) [Bifidobacterium bohemicum]
MKRRKIAASLICGMLLMAPLTACGSGSSSSGGETIEFMTMQGTGTPRLKILQTMAKKFEKENPGVTIKATASSDNAENDIKVRLAGHNPPDIWATHGWSRDRYGNFLEPLQNRSWAKQVKPICDDFLKDKNGNIYGLPADLQVSGIMYNKTVLEQAGVDPKALNTWDDFDQACEKVKAAGLTPIVASPKDFGIQGDIADYLLPGLHEKSDLERLQKGKFTTKNFEEYASMVKKWADSKYFNVDYVSASPDDDYRYMASNKAAFFLRSNTFGQMMESFNPDVKLGMMPVPSKVGKPYFSAGEEFAFGVSKTSKHKQTALKFIDFLAKPENMKELVKVSMNDSALKNVPAALGQFQDTYDYWVNEKKTQTVPFFDRKYLPNGMYTTLAKSTDGIITGQLSPSAAADQMKTSFESLYGQKS